MVPLLRFSRSTMTNNSADANAPDAPRRTPAASACSRGIMRVLSAREAVTATVSVVASEQNKECRPDLRFGL